METDFWQSEKIYLMGALEKRILANQEKVSWGHLKKQELPEILRSTLYNQAKIIFKTEKPLRIIQSERFDFSLPQLKRELSSLRDTFMDSVLFTAEEVNKAIQFSVDLGFDIITRPQKTCLAILFDVSLERFREDIDGILRGLSIGSPFINSLIETIASTEKRSIKKTHFRHILSGLDVVLYQENPVEIFLDETRLLLDFYTNIGDDMEDNLSAEIIHGMLVERSMHNLAADFQAAASEKPFWNLEDIHSFLTRNIESESYPSMAQTQHAGDEEKIIDDEHEAPEPEKGKNPLAEEFLPINDDIDSDDLTEIAADEIPAAENLPDAADDLDLHDDILVTAENHTLYTLIDDAVRAGFIKKIFDGNEAVYEEFIESLESRENWQSAKAELDTKLKERQISVFSREAIKFGDLLFKRFVSKGQY